MSEPVTVETLRALCEAFNRHDVDAILEFFAEDCSMDLPLGHDAWGTRYVGREAVRAGLASRFEGLPDVHYGDDRHFVSGDRGASEWHLTGTRPDGERVDVYGCDLWEFAGGKVSRKDSYWKRRV